MSIKKSLTFLILVLLSFVGCNQVSEDTLINDLNDVEEETVDQTVEKDFVVELAEEVTDNVFTYEDLDIGDRYGSFTVESIEPIIEGREITENSMMVGFRGEAEVYGDYEYFDGDHAFWVNQGCFTVKGVSSMSKIPLYEWFADNSEKFFCFTNNDFVVQKFGTKKQEGINIVISGYTANILEAAIIDLTEFKELK